MTARRRAATGRGGSAGAALLLVLLLGACSLSGGEGASGGLVGTSWVVVEVAGTPTLETARPTMAFGEDGRVEGSDGCGPYSMAFRTDGDAIELGDVIGTDVGCDPVVSAQRDAFRQALGGAAHWRQAPDGSLELGRGDIVAVPGGALPSAGPGEATSAQLEGTSWVLVDLGGSADLLGTTVTLDIGDGTLAGSGGCNTYRGPYLLDGPTISIGPLATTKMACPPPAGDVEATYLRALDAAGRWSIDDAGSLVLEGPTPLAFEPA